MRPPRWLPAAILAALAGGLYLRTIRFEFVFDDINLIVNNPFLRELFAPLLALRHPLAPGTPHGAGDYRPVVTASLALNGRFLGWGAAGFHLVNLILHAANAILVHSVARRLAIPGWAALLAAALFAAHPAASWSVAPIMGRADLLSGFFLLLAWRAGAEHESFAASPARPSEAPGAPARRPAIGSACFLFLALLSKESAIAFLAVPILALREFRGAAALLQDEPAEGHRRWWAAGALAASGAYVFCRAAIGKVGILQAASQIDPIVNPMSRLPAGDRMLASLELFGRYLPYLIFPVRGVGDPRDPSAAAAAPAALSSGVILGAALLLAWGSAILLLWRRRDSLCLPLAFALAAFLPPSSLLFPIPTPSALGALYMPLIGLCLVAGGGTARLADARSASGAPARRAPRAAWAGLPLVALLALGAVREAAIWRDPILLFASLSERFPRYVPALSGLGAAQLAAGRPAEAIPILRRALEFDAENAEANHNLGTALLLVSTDEAGMEEALRHTRAAIKTRPDLIPARINASKILLSLNRPAEAEQEAREALRLSPDLFVARLNLAESLFRQTRYDEAAAEFVELAAVDPGNPDVRSPLIVSLLRARRLEEARRAAESARAAFPSLAWFDFCLARIEARSGRPQEAIALLGEALRRDPATSDWLRQVDDFEPYRGRPDFEALLTRDPSDSAGDGPLNRGNAPPAAPVERGGPP